MKRQEKDGVGDTPAQQQTDNQTIDPVRQNTGERQTNYDRPLDKVEGEMDNGELGGFDNQETNKAKPSA